MIRIGFEIGCSELAAIALNAGGDELGRARQDAPQAIYVASIEAIGGGRWLGARHGPAGAVGMPDRV